MSRPTSVVPDRERHDTAGQRHEDKPERGAVGEALARSLGVLRLLDELDDLRERRVRADCARAGAQRAVLVDRGTDQLGAGTRVHRQALTRHGRLVDVAVTLFDDRVDGEALTGADQQQIAEDNVSAVASSTASLSRSTTALAGARSSSARIASFAPPRARISNQWPSVQSACD